MSRSKAFKDNFARARLRWLVLALPRREWLAEAWPSAAPASQQRRTLLMEWQALTLGHCHGAEPTRAYNDQWAAPGPTKQAGRALAVGTYGSPR
jgi:hypothetical protein